VRPATHVQDTVAHLYEQSQRRLRAVAARYVGDDAEDVVQDAFLKALRCGTAFRGDAAPLTWVSRIVINTSIDRCRRRRRWEHAYPYIAPRRSDAAAALDDTFALRTALRRLSRDQRRVFVLYHVLGYTHREIARRLAIPPGTSKSRLSDARRRLRQSLGLA
jgi:RNA polymerase sigma-70 factor (ECF subfamily)